MPTYQRKLTKGILWFYQFDLNGKTYKSKTIYLTKQEAKKAEAEAYQEAMYRQRNPTEPQEISLLQAINERLDYIRSRKTEKYYRENKRYFSIALNRFGNISIDLISRAEIESLLQKESIRGAYSVNALLRCLKALFNHAIDTHNLSIRNPCHKIKFYSVEKRIKYVPSDKEIEMLLKVCDEDQRRLIEFLRDTGARLSEALNLKGKDVTNTEVILFTKKSANSNLTPRRVPKPDCLVGLTFLPDKKVFGNWTEQPKFITRKLKALNLTQWGFHNLRHRYASILSAEGKPLFQIMSLLGHSNIDTTQKYLQLLG